MKIKRKKNQYEKRNTILRLNFTKRKLKYADEKAYTKNEPKRDKI